MAKHYHIHMNDFFGNEVVPAYDDQSREQNGRFNSTEKQAWEKRKLAE